MLSKSLKWQFQNNQMPPVPKPTNWPMPSKTKPANIDRTVKQNAV